MTRLYWNWSTSGCFYIETALANFLANFQHSHLSLFSSTLPTKDIERKWKISQKFLKGYLRLSDTKCKEFSKIIFCSYYFVVDFELHEYVSCTIVTLIIHIKHRGWDSSWQKNLMKCTVSMNSNWDVACKNWHVTIVQDMASNFLFSIILAKFTILGVLCNFWSYRH